MKAVSISTLLLVLFTTNTFAVSDGNLLGRITVKETKQPLAFAEITLESSMDKVVVTANEYGLYYANHIPTGKYKMTVVFNNRTFVMKNVRVYDGYTIEANMALSNDTALAAVVEVPFTESQVSSVQSTDITLRSNGNKQATKPLSEALSAQPGIDIRDGRLFVKGSDQVKVFIDGTPVMGQPRLDRIW